MKIKISHIKVGDRFRKDFGDLQGLADSIAELGQLHPIGVDSNYNLIFGERRIKACELLGRDTVEGSVIHLDSLIKGEFAENEFSKGWTVSERVAILEAIETHGQGARTDKQPRQNFAEVSKDEAAKQAGQVAPLTLLAVTYRDLDRCPKAPGFRAGVLGRLAAGG